MISRPAFTAARQFPNSGAFPAPPHLCMNSGLGPADLPFKGRPYGRSRRHHMSRSQENHPRHRRRCVGPGRRSGSHGNGLGRRHSEPQPDPEHVDRHQRVGRRLGHARRTQGLIAAISRRTLPPSLVLRKRKVTEAIQAFREANKPTAAPAEGTKPDRSARTRRWPSPWRRPWRRGIQGHRGTGGNPRR